MSNTPPGGNGRTSRIGRSGYATASMPRAAPANAAAPPARRKNSRRPNFMRSSLPLIRQGEALPSSIHFGAGKLHDPSPLFGFNGDEAFELRGRHRLGVAAKLFDARL